MCESGIKVLIVEDEPRSAESLAIGLKRNELTVQIANCGKEGLQKLHRSTFDYILCDINMPQMDGWEFADRAKAYTLAEFIFVTADSRLVKKKEYSDCLLLIKPLEINSIIELLNERIEVKCK